jgi:hypothetical protein
VWLKDERLAVRDGDQLGEVVHRMADVYKRVAGDPKNAAFSVEAEID